MNRPRLKKQLAAPALATVACALALYLFYQLAPPAPPPDAPAEQREAFEAYAWTGRLLKLGLWLSFALILVRALNELVFFVFRKRRGYAAPSLVRDLFSLVAYALSAAIILNRLFPDLSLGALLSGSALLGIILGLALQDTLGNLFAGISLHADKPFQVGDVIAVGQFTGVVESITWRAVKIRTFQHHIVLVSNSGISKESIEVCPRDNTNARLVFFNALYTDPPAKVIAAVREAVRDADNVLRYMTPNVRVRGLGESGVDYEVKYWLEDYARYNDTDALVRQRIWYAFRRHGFNFAYPTRTIYHVPQAEASAADGDGRRERFAGRLAGVDIFSPLSPEERARLAEGCVSFTYAPGEAIIREGEGGDSMFVVHRGRVEVRVSERDRQRVVNTLGEGAVFGEMALLTGEPRAASVVAVEETEVLEIGHGALRRLFETNPGLVEALSQKVARRRAGLAAKAEEASVGEEERAGLITSIRRFFRLD